MQKERTDKQLLDGLEKVLKSGGIVEFTDGEVFSIESQWQKGQSIRELANTVLDFAEGKRNWQKENWR